MHNVRHDFFQASETDGSPRATHGTLNLSSYLDSLARSPFTTDHAVFPVIIENLQSLIEVLKLKIVDSKSHSANPSPSSHNFTTAAQFGTFMLYQDSLDSKNYLKNLDDSTSLIMSGRCVALERKIAKIFMTF